MRRITAETLYETEMELRRQGWGADPALVYDEERDLFRFRDGQFAFSRTHGNWELLKKRGPYGVRSDLVSPSALPLAPTYPCPVTG
jgi:hypothetical protein